MSDKKQAEFLTLELRDPEINDAFYRAIRPGARHEDIRALGNRLSDLAAIEDTCDSQMSVLFAMWEEHVKDGMTPEQIRQTVIYWAGVGFLVAIAHAFEAGLVAGKRRWDKEAAA